MESKFKKRSRHAGTGNAQSVNYPKTMTNPGSFEQAFLFFRDFLGSGLFHWTHWPHVWPANATKTEKWHKDEFPGTRRWEKGRQEKAMEWEKWRAWGRGGAFIHFLELPKQHHKLRGLNNRNLLLLALEARSLEQGLGGVGSSWGLSGKDLFQASLLASGSLQHSLACRWCSCVFISSSLCPNFCFYRGHPMTSF